MRIVGILILGFSLVGVAHAQPWRVKIKGRYVWTNNVEDLPPAKRAKVLEKWRNAEGKIVPPKAAEPEPSPETDPDRFPKVGIDAVRTAQGKAKSDEKKDEAATPETDPRVLAAAEAAKLASQLATAKSVLQAARRKAYEVPSGQAYAARSKAESKVLELESKLARAKARAGL